MSSPNTLLPLIICHAVFLSSSLLHTCRGADDTQVDPTSVSLGSYLPPQGSTNNVVLASPNGMFNLRVQSWTDFPAHFCMAAVLNVKIDPGSMLWAANNAQPLRVASSCSLYLSYDGDLLLQDDSNHTAWQTHTAGLGVSNLTLHDSGNLVLHTKQGLIVWQSFTQTPAFGLISGMSLTSNITIYSSADIPNGIQVFNVPGSFAMQLLNNSILALFTTTDSSSRFVYWSTSFTGSLLHANAEQVAYVTVDNAFTFYDNTSQALGSVAPTSEPPSNWSSALRVAKLDPSSANLLAFYRTTHAWVRFYNSSISACENPGHCGNFGLCNASTGACTCPPGFHQNATGNCDPETDLSNHTPSCSSAFSLADASLYSFVSVNVSFPPQLSALSSLSVENCTSLCLNSCTCKVALFDPAASSCSLFSNLGTVQLRADSKKLMLLKIAAAKRHSSKIRLAAILGALCASLCSICALVAIYCKKRRRNRNSSLRGPPNEEVFLQALPRLPPRYTYKELETATKEFSTKLGSGAFGAVYEGVLPSGVRLAVKKLEEAGGQSSVQFRAEVASIGSVSHMNLVTLKGFCHEGEVRLLVYEHMSRGSLDRWLFEGREEKRGNELGWDRRCKIAMDTAKGLAYLHHECGEKIVHCDVKPENILLDEEFNAKVGDFGLAKLVGQGRQSFAMSTLKGTRGYLAPEWLQAATITAKSDVYSFGIVLLELISGRRCLDSDYGYLPTLAFHLASISSSTSVHPKYSSTPLEGQWKQEIPLSSNQVPDAPQPIRGSPTRHEGATGIKGSLSATGIPFNSTTFPQCEPITGFPTSHERVARIPPEHASSGFAPSAQHSSMVALLDARLSLDGEVSPASLERMIFIGLWCVQSSPSVRPPMSVVVAWLLSLNRRFNTLCPTTTNFSTSHPLLLPSNVSRPLYSSHVILVRSACILSQRDRHTHTQSCTYRKRNCSLLYFLDGSIIT